LTKKDPFCTNGDIKCLHYKKNYEWHLNNKRGSERRISELLLAKNFRTSKVSFKLIRTSKFKKIRTSKVTYLWRFAFLTWLNLT
jgi:hypothetical protein